MGYGIMSKSSFYKVYLSKFTFTWAFSLGYEVCPSSCFPVIKRIRVYVPKIDFYKLLIFVEKEPEIG
jgi:hypothetical protein